MPSETGGKYTGSVFDELYTLYGNDVLRTAYYYLGEKQRAEDICQDVFTKLFLYTGDITPGKERAWLLRVTINACRDYWRSSWAKRVLLGPPMMELLPDERDIFEERQEREELAKAILTLPAQFREIILLYYYQNFTLQEIASILGISEGTVASRLARGRYKLEAVLKDWNGDGAK
ncbi:MAG: sigma-70 family RNA polymerase sigma factor [Clostridia bacterium]|nr:sigma-70 family RNA polymerase sigma factor [Clostridia bacterium]